MTEALNNSPYHINNQLTFHRIDISRFFDDENNFKIVSSTLEILIHISTPFSYSKLYGNINSFYLTRCVYLDPSVLQFTHI